MSTPASRPFRFGVVSTPHQGPDQWLATARRVEELGYDTLLMPDGLQLLSPLLSLTAAAGATTKLRVGTFVLASPLRVPRAAAWDAHTVSVLTGGRFELGIGTGREDVRGFAAQLGLPFGSADERLGQIDETVRQLHELDGEGRTPVLVAAAGPKAQRLAGRIADTVTIPNPPLAGVEKYRVLAERQLELAGDRADRLELAMNLFVIGDQVPPGLERAMGVTAEELTRHQSAIMLRGGVDDMAEELLQRRERVGLSYLCINAAFIEPFAPVIQRLRGQ